MGRKQQFFFISAIIVLVASACQVSATPVTTPEATEIPTQPATNLPVFPLPTATMGAENELPAIFPSFFLTDPNTVCLEHSYHAFSCLDAAGWHVYKNGYDIISKPAYTIPTWMLSCPDGRTYLTGPEVYKLEGKELVDLGESFDMSMATMGCGSGNEIWVSSMHGVSRFDGSTWTDYSIEEIFPVTEADYLIYSMAVAPNGNVWVTSDHRIATFDGTGWKAISPSGNPDYWEGSQEEGLVIDSTGTVWAITFPETCCSDGQLSRYDGIQWTTFPGPEHETEFSSGPEIEFIAADRENRIWAVTSNEKIYTFNPQSGGWDFKFDIQELGLGNSSYPVTSMKFDGQDRLWLTTDYGVGIYDGSTWTIYHMHTAKIYSNKISGLFVLGTVPNLPALEVKPAGSILGKLVSDKSKPFVNALVEVCLKPVLSQYFEGTPCADQRYHVLTDVNADGSFLVPNVPPGNYYLMMYNSGSWGIMVDSNFSQLFRPDGVEFTVLPGEETQLGEISTSPETAGSRPEPVVTVAPAIPEATVSVAVTIVSHAKSESARLEVWLEFAFQPGDVLPGSQIESDLNNGSLELTLPGGEKKTYARVPHSPTDSEVTSDIWLPEGIAVQMSPPPAGTLPLIGMSFENYTDSPHGPQIRVPIETLPDISAKGQYQITWQSGSLHSNTVTFEWDGSKITIHVP